MILFFPQWQGAGRGDANRIDFPARVLFESMLDRIYEMAGAKRGRMAPVNVVEVPLIQGDDLVTERGIIGRQPVLKQLQDARALLDQHQPESVFTLGGDCGIEVAPVGYLAEKYPDMALLWIDGHPDLNTPESSPSGTFHGMPLRVLMNEGDPDFIALVPRPLAPAQVTMVAARSFDAAEREFVDRHGIVNVPVGTPDLAQQVVRHLATLDTQNVYLHVDLDALDPAEWPHMHYPEPAGLRIAELASLLDAVRRAFRVVGMSITEYDSVDGKALRPLAPVLDLFAQCSAR